MTDMSRTGPPAAKVANGVKYSVVDLIGWRLDLAVAKFEGATAWQFHEDGPRDPGRLYVRFPGGHPDDCDEPREEFIAMGQYHPSREWHQGGPILEREKIATAWLEGEWRAWHPADAGRCGYYGEYALDVNAGDTTSDGPTPLVAAMRAFLTARAGGTVELPA